jgi:hypothetical protein
VLALIPHGPIAGRFVAATPKEDTMYAQLTYFDGPRSPEQVAAADFASRQRLEPAIRSLGLPVRVYRLRRDDGAEIVLTIAENEQALLDMQKAIVGTGLLPGEDPTLLPGPDRIEMFPVLEFHDLTAEGNRG